MVLKCTETGNVLETIRMFQRQVSESQSHYLPKEEVREGGEKKARAALPPGPGLEPGTCRVLGEGPQLHARGAV